VAGRGSLPIVIHRSTVFGSAPTASAFDALMANAVPSGASIITPSTSDHFHRPQLLDMPAVPGGSGHRNDRHGDL
jgi:hypothetical protein